jgi:hypothetical protein
MPTKPKAAPGTFSIKFSSFNEGAAPVAHLDTLTQLGSAGQYSAAGNVDIISFPGLLTQGPGLSTLTNATEAGAVGELINFIIDRPVSSGMTYGIAATKLHQITASAVTNTGSWPHAITSAVAGSSVHYIRGKLFYFFNKASAGEIGMYDLASSFTDNWGSTVPTGAAALQKADHPVASKQDIMIFGNGRYLGTYIDTTTTLNPTKLDFGTDAAVADTAFHANQWWIAVNQGSGVATDRQSASIFLYDASATTTLLADEIAVGVQKIGFILPIEGVMYVAFQDLSTPGGFCIGYVNGRGIKPLRYFTGTLPTFAQKTLYGNMITFISNGLVYSCGASIETMPVQISQLASGGFSTVGAIAAPFGTPMVASTQSTSFKLAKFSGYDVNATWRSLVIALAQANMLGFIDRIVVLTNTLGAGARCDLIVEANQASATGTTLQITGTNKRRHVFNNIGLTAIEDFRAFLNWANGSTSNPVKIREIQVQGHFIEHA